LNTRIEEAKKEANEAEQNLAAFSREHKIYSPDDQAKAAIEQMAAFDKAIGDIEVSAKAAQASLEAANAQLSVQKASSKAYHISDNATVQNLRDQIVAKRVALVGLEQRYTDQHPSVQQTRRELQQLQSSLDAEVVATVDSNATTLNPTQAELLKQQALASVNLAVANASESALQAQRSKREEELGQFPDDVMEYIRLNRNSSIKNEIYVNLVKQYEQGRIQAAMDSMDIQVVDSANLPDVEKPVAPRKKLITALGFMIGVFFAMGYGLLLYKRES
jgi:possible lipopolysaccharide biosynthesis protein